MNVSPLVARLVVPFGILIALGCAARTPLEELDRGTGQPAVGGGPGMGGRAGGGAGGKPVQGGFVAGGGGWSSGGIVGGGGVWRSGGTTASGGTIRSGGSRAGGSAGASPSGGGAEAQGGSGGSVGGGVGPVVPSGGSAGAGGTRPSGGTIGSGGSGACPGQSSHEDLIDDLNDGDRYILAGKGRFGEWKVYDDGTPGGAMSPSPFTPTHTGDICRKYAAYIKGYGFTSTGVNMSFGLGSPYDARMYTGITFWARIEPGTRDGIRVAFPNRDTDPDGGVCSGTSGATGCYSHFGFRATFTTEWQRYYISFSQLTQDPWGLQAKTFDSASIYEVMFQIPENATFGLWIDDVAFTYPDLR